jgi:hypothetical protein
VAATEPQRSHTPESYPVDFQPTCDGGRGRLDARYQYRRKVQSPLGAFYRGLQLLLEATAYADSSIGSADQNCVRSSRKAIAERHLWPRKSNCSRFAAFPSRSHGANIAATEISNARFSRK